MTKKDYEKFAKMFADLLAETDNDKTDPVWKFIDKTCAIFQEDNPRFDWNRFINKIRVLYADRDAK
jgi:hypothetical protein